MVLYKWDTRILTTLTTAYALDIRSISIRTGYAVGNKHLSYLYNLLTNLCQRRLVTRPARGVYRLTTAGRRALAAAVPGTRGRPRGPRALAILVALRDTPGASYQTLAALVGEPSFTAGAASRLLARHRSRNACYMAVHKFQKCGYVTAGTSPRTDRRWTLTPEGHAFLATQHTPYTHRTNYGRQTRHSAYSQP